MPCVDGPCVPGGVVLVVHRAGKYGGELELFVCDAGKLKMMLAAVVGMPSSSV